MSTSLGLVSSIPTAQSIEQLQSVYTYVDDIIAGMDEVALNELFSGSEKDVDKILNELIKTTEEVLYGQAGPLQSGAFGYLEKVTDSFDEALKIISFNYFVQSTMPKFQMGLHHIEWGNMVQLYRWLCIIAARDHGKSYHMSFAYPIWKMYRYRENNPYLSAKENGLNKLGLLITNEHDLAKKFLGFIRDEIEVNPLLREKLYPDYPNATWGKESIKCKNGAELEVKGSGSSLRGRHPNWMVLDDYLNESSLYSKEQRLKAIEVFKGVIQNLLVPGGEWKVIGTPMAQDDLYDDLKKSKKWKVFEYPAIFPDGRVLWPERWNLAGLLEKKDTQGSAVFTREILVRPISSESSIFPYEITKTAYVGMEHFTLADNIYTFNTRVKMKKVVIGCDFAISANVGADYTVFTVMGIDEWGNYWLIYQWREKGAGYNEMISKMKWMNSNFRPDYFYAESNGFQKVIIDLAREKGVHNIIEHTTTINKWDIKTGLPGLAVVFENGRMKFPRGDERSKAVSDNILAELNGFTWDIELKMQSVASHDDAAMSCWLAVKGLSLTSSNMEIGYL